VYTEIERKSNLVSLRGPLVELASELYEIITIFHIGNTYE